MDQLAHAATKSTTDWLWEGYLARGSLTLLTSLWKAGKTTGIVCLLRTGASPFFPPIRSRARPLGRE
jgi:hypothetical protein